LEGFKKYYFSVAFLAILSLPIINDCLGLVKFKRTDENRLFHDKLEIDIAKLDKFPENFDTYFNDNFTFRTPLLKIFHKIKFKVFHVSSNQEDVLIGKDGWYFLGGIEKEIFEGRKNFTEEELELFNKLWTERINYLTSKKIKTYWLICPTKHAVYTDKLPSNVIINNGLSRTQLLKTKIDQQFPNLILDPTSFLINQRKRYKLYFQLDNHWNQRAGNLVSRYILNNLKKDFPLLNPSYLDDYLWKDTIKQDGIHYAALGINELAEKIEIATAKHSFTHEIKRYGFKPPKDFVYQWDYEKRFNNEANGKYRILVIRDSFGDDIIPFLKEAFRESVFIFDNWKYGMDKEIIDKIKPDIVLYISLETHIENFISNK
jgi:hypothetical protein